MNLTRDEALKIANAAVTFVEDGSADNLNELIEAVNKVRHIRDYAAIRNTPKKGTTR